MGLFMTVWILLGFYVEGGEKGFINDSKLLQVIVDIFRNSFKNSPTDLNPLKISYKFRIIIQLKLQLTFH